MSLVPLLPPELERQIFELAAYCEPLSVPKFMLVAWRVKQWVENFLYRVLMLRGRHNSYTQTTRPKLSYSHPENEHFSRIKAVPPTILRNSVRHLYVHCIPLDLAATILSSCDAVHDLWIYQGDNTPIVELAGHLRLRRLHCHATELFGKARRFDANGDEIMATHIDFALPIFARLTHLELLGWDGDRPEWAGIATIPRLTHLALAGEFFIHLAVLMLETPEPCGYWCSFPTGTGSTRWRANRMRSF
ncbi:hypothetical protein FB45DRAFT_906468 [Roridomyces roridus]|uniref:Uncharacterized protein n=1 Tax=Roridomyces roridus TaxID=1738132 RepID=A0AAD7C133_9AGAR|nr:hypothetical protein FB45DRAFT_906468 [Roridomyces roridus]